MKRWFVVWIGFVLLSLVGCQPLSPAEAQAPPEKVDLHRQVQLLNLINGLELTPEQMRFVLDRARQAQERREALEAQADEKQMETILEEIRDTLMAGRSISPELRERFSAARADQQRLIETYREEMTELAREVEVMLEDHQRYALERYVPCVIPPPGELRIGQAQGMEGAAALERLREIPAARFETHEQRIARRVLEQLKRRFHRPVLILDEEAELERIVELMRSARALSALDFELQKESLVEELLAPYEAARPPVDPTAVIARHLLDPAIIPLLEEKLTPVEK
ncbi:MAG TPA: hypothetical protein ENN99_07205 [Chloroflexi bacterium]|nr:hypothetical protein [Chloroflexota bacterium]